MNTTPFSQPSRINRRGISLFEMLLVVSILGIMAAFALPSFGQQRDVFADVKAKRNAQELVSESTVAQAAGATDLVGSTVEEMVEKLLVGVRVTEGAFAGREFGLRGMKAEDAQAAVKHLKVVNGQLALR
jgi:prepilin-type N-terminal cleavage/methylation domain-containing protein